MSNSVMTESGIRETAMLSFVAGLTGFAFGYIAVTSLSEEQANQMLDSMRDAIEHKMQSEFDGVDAEAVTRIVADITGSFRSALKDSYEYYKPADNENPPCQS